MIVNQFGCPTGIQAPDELLARIGWRQAARRARKQADTDLLLETFDRVTECGRFAGTK